MVLALIMVAFVCGDFNEVSSVTAKLSAIPAQRHAFDYIFDT